MRVKKTARKQKRRTGLPSPNIGVNKIMHRMFTIIHCVWLRESEHWEPVLQQRSSCYALKSTYTTIGVYFVCRIFLNGERFLFYFYYFSLLCFCSGERHTAVAAAEIKVDTIQLHLLIFQQFSFFLFHMELFHFLFVCFYCNFHVFISFFSLEFLRWTMLKRRYAAHSGKLSVIRNNLWMLLDSIDIHVELGSCCHFWHISSVCICMQYTTMQRRIHVYYIYI